MGIIKLLDCTLRDGGYINDWNFGESNIKETIKNLVKSRMDIIELGFLKDEPYQKDRTVFNSTDQLSALIRPKKPNTDYAAMIEVINPIALEMLAPRNDETVDIIRVIVWKQLLQKGFDYCKGIVEKGYRLCVQPARVDQYSYDDFVNMIDLFKQLNPLAIYVVDSFGTQDKSALMEYINLADNHLPADVALGYHGHNNLMQAFGTAEALLELNLNREIIIDASVYGIGRGAGNLNTELIALHLNARYNTHYEIEPMLEVYENCLKHIFVKSSWGYSLPAFLTALYNCNPNYLNYYGQDLGLSATDIDGVLRTINEDDRIIFTEEVADRYWTAYKESRGV